jgi:hypothetical protein
MATYRTHGTQAVSGRSDLGWWLKHGAIGGLIAGIVFAMFEMIVAALMMGMDAFWMPMRMIGAIVLGQAALDPSYSLATAGLVGIVVHMMLSVIYGVIFGAVVAQSDVAGHQNRHEEQAQRAPGDRLPWNSCRIDVMRVARSPWPSRKESEV